MVNTSREIRVERRIEIVNEFMRKLRRSGYGEGERKEIL